MNFSNNFQQHKKSILQFLFATVFALAFSLVLVQLKLDFLESYLDDIRFRLRPNTSENKDIEIILIDQKTVEHFKRIPNYNDYREVSEQILKENPKALIFVTPLIKSDDSEDEQSKALSSPTGSFDEGMRLANTLMESGKAFQITDRLFLKGEIEKNRLPKPFQHINLLAGPKTADLNLFAKDGVTRRVLVDYQEEPLGHFQIATLFNPNLKNLSDVQGIFDVYETKQVLIDFKPNGSFSITKFEDFIRQTVPKDKFKNKLVLFGDDLGKSLKSYVKTPYSRDPSAMTLVEMHANMFNTFIKNSAPIRAPIWIDWLLTSIISVFTLYVVLMLRPLKGMWVLVVAALTLSLIGYISFWPFSILIPMAHPYLAVFLCYYFFIPYRLIVENRRSWEYQQKNQLLSQVEELKTNFISMMSHDLKTPIARIQGMTDLISKESAPLNTPQREALDHIRSSSDDLLRVISSILNYAKIESDGVQLQKQSRDINSLLKEVIKRHEFLAQLKKIELLNEFETLFPIEIDPELIRQIFSNLIENAIKYSPEGSKVLITTEETADVIRIQVADQGPGIANQDLPHIFTKFFRSGAAKSSQIKGSGLGLYLAQYFTHLHGGRLGVESEYGQGTTFTVELPIKT